MERLPPGEMDGSRVAGEDAASSGAWHRTRDGGSRREAWVKIARDIRVPNHYHALLELAGETPETAAQIEKDLPRTGATFAKQGFRLNPGEPTWRALRNILTAYAAHDPETGYVQSMNFQAAFLVLAGLDEEDAFWCLVALVTKIVPGYFSEGMAAAKLDQRVFSRLVHQHLPAVGLHLETIAPDNIVPAIISSQWLLTLFVNVLPAGATMRVWDRVFESETRAPLFACALALLEPAHDAILACDEMGETVELLQSLGQETQSDENAEEADNSAGGGAEDAAVRDADEVANVSLMTRKDSEKTAEKNDTDASFSSTSGKEDALIARMDAYLAGACAPLSFLKEVSRERGRRRRPSDDGLPEAVKRAVPAVTEIDELVDGLRSDLRDVIGEGALARADAEADAREEAERAAAEKGARAAARAARRDARRAAAAAAAADAVGPDASLASLRGAAADTAADSAEASSGSDDSEDDAWELTPGPTAVGAEWADNLLAAGWATRGVASDAAQTRRVFFPERNGPEFDSFRVPDRVFGSPETSAERRFGEPPLGMPSLSLSSSLSSSREGETRADFADSAGCSGESKTFVLPSAFADAFARAETSARRVDEALSTVSFPAFARAYADVARTVAFAPVRALAEAHPRLLAKRETFADELKTFREMAIAAQRALASSASDEDAGLAFRPGSGARDAGLPIGGPAWTAWADSLFEHVIRRADETMEGLRDAANVLDRVARETRGDFPEKETSTSRDTEPGGFGLAPEASRMSACADAHETRVAHALRQCASAANVIAEDAKNDLPLLAANREKTAADLRREAQSAAAAIATWSAAAESRRRRKTKAALDAMRDAADAAAAAFEAGTAEDAAAAAAATPPPPPPTRVSSRPPSEDDGFPPSRRDPASLAASFALEDAQLESASVSLATAVKTVSRRKNAVARERANAEAVRLQSEKTALDAKRRAARLERVASACETSLKKRVDCFTLQSSLLPSLEASVLELGAASAALVREGVENDHLPWLTASADAAALTYVSVLDAAAQRLDAFADVCAARLSERAAKAERGASFSFRGAEGRTIIGGLLEDAAELIAPASRLDASASKEAEAARGDGDAAERRREENFSEREREKKRDEEDVSGKKKPTDNRAASDAGGASPANQFPLLRDRGAKAFSSLAFGVENGMAKLSGAFQGSAVGGALAKTFGGKKEKDVETSEGFSPSSPSVVSAASVTQSPSPAEGPAFAASASASAPRESRALREARDDLRRLETRRDELLEKKKRLRAFLSPARESATAQRTR